MKNWGLINYGVSVLKQGVSLMGPETNEHIIQLKGGTKMMGEKL